MLYPIELRVRSPMEARESVRKVEFRDELKMAHGVVHERRRMGDDRRDLLLQLQFVAAAEDEFGNKIRRPPLSRRSAANADA